VAPRYVWTYDVGSLVHGGTKARNDCYKIAEQAGWVRFDTTLNGSALTRIFGLFKALARLAQLDRASIFLIQTPIHSGIGNNIIAYVMAIFFKTATIVHDIDDLRGGKSNTSEFLIEFPVSSSIPEISFNILKNQRTESSGSFNSKCGII